MANLPQVTSRDQAAAAVGVSGRIVQDAEHVKRHAPEVFEEVKAGRMTVHAAVQEVKEREGEEAKPYKVTAMMIAEKAIFTMSQIGPRMEGRDEAFKRVISWVRKQQRRQ